MPDSRRALGRRVAGTIAAERLIESGDRVAIAVSGGPDSVALLWLLRDCAAAPAAMFSIAGLIHVNHGLRGHEAARDEAFCRALAERMMWPIEVGSFDVPELARAAHRSYEATAREVRYRFFAEASRRLGASRVATGHTLDDQAETVMLRLLRGAGSRGAGGVRPRRGLFIRPLIECRHDELVSDLAARGEPFCVDSSNADVSIPRNRIRHELMPLISRISSGGPAALARFARLAQDDEAFLSERAIQMSPGFVLSDDGGVQLERGALAALPAAIARRVIRRMIEQVSGGSAAAFTARHVEAIRALVAADNPDGHLDVPGVSVEVRPGICLARRAVGARASDPVAFERPLPVPGSVQVPEAGVVVMARVVPWTSAIAADGRRDEACVQVGTFEGPIAVRNRRPGDRFRPFGAPGRRKVQDVFVDRKVPRVARDRVPIVVDARGRIVWVVGHAMAEECRVRQPEAGVVLLKVQAIEEP
jgi:tRNA(Ile)-lysidine synthase